ncbi:MAG TPA: PEGA domain-containing protein [Candidatus Saccharimonadales bacterium]|nr:PEGA domain-containing protein [Candidatus Saccharimonadales bacterium]
MDFLDPEKQKAHSRRLALGYALIGLVLVLATTILLYVVYGFGLDKEGRVIQNGLVFVSSHPTGGTIYIDKKQYRDKTNTRVPLPAGQYVLELARTGYGTWKRAITVEGGIVERFDYPLLYPSTLASATTKRYESSPAFTSNSHDRQWLLVGMPSSNDFDLYDLDVKKPTATILKLNPDILAAGSTTTNWEVVDWAANNRTVLLKRTYTRNGQPGTEYILLDRQDATAAQNLSVLFGFSPANLSFNGRAQDKFYAFDPNNGQVLTVEIKKPTPQPYLSDVVAFVPDGDTVLYVTSANAPSGKVLVRMRQKLDAPYTIRQLPAGTQYLLKLGNYSNEMLAAAGASSDNKVYIYKNPIDALKEQPADGLAPIHILKVDSPTYISYSPNKRMFMAENGDQFAVYDAETDKGYAYKMDMSLDEPIPHASWMDGYRLNIVSGGKLVAFDFDGSNMRKLAAANPALLPGYDSSYRYMYTVNTEHDLINTALLTPEDL